MRTASSQTWKILQKRTTRLLTVLVVAVSAFAVVPAAPASAAYCNYSWSNKSGQASDIYGNGVNYRTGPYTSCDSLGQFGSDNYVYAHCWRFGTMVDSDNIWWHVRLYGTTRQGWVSDVYLLDLATPVSAQC
ncbi:hypothetical protein AB0J14_17680 [Micromonospora arborensis]|uniref:hypothetical protein n=1 Tax=Micromonospora arborensis TaxID=2116518 RepID=UPI0033F4688F